MRVPHQNNKLSLWGKNEGKTAVAKDRKNISTSICKESGRQECGRKVVQKIPTER
jgi:hypothetical protein